MVYWGIHRDSMATKGRVGYMPGSLPPPTMPPRYYAPHGPSLQHLRVLCASWSLSHPKRYLPGMLHTLGGTYPACYTPWVYHRGAHTTTLGIPPWCTYPPRDTHLRGITVNNTQGYPPERYTLLIHPFHCWSAPKPPCAYNPLRTVTFLPERRIKDGLFTVLSERGDLGGPEPCLPTTRFTVGLTFPSRTSPRFCQF